MRCGEQSESLRRRTGTSKGDAARELEKAATVLDATYRCDYAYHAQMEPLNAVASVSPAGDAVELWCGTQSQSLAVEATAEALGIARSKVKLNDLLMGGGFGRRGHRDEEFIVDAVLLSKEIGKPVKVLWTREDDVRNGRFRPITAHHVRAGLEPQASSSPGTSGRRRPGHAFVDMVRLQARRR